MDFLFFFFIIYGFKISVVDFSVLIPLFILIVRGKGLVLDKNIVTLIVGLMILCSYQVVIQLVYHSFHLEFVLRLIRSGLIIIIIYSFSTNRPYIDYKNMILKCITLHALLVIFFSFFPHFSIGIAEILGQRSPRYFRSPGLLSGFDMSGLLNIIGILLIVIKDKVDFKSVINLLLLLIAGFLSSRGTIIIVAIILLYFILTLHKKECGNFLKLALYLFVSFVTCFTLMFIYQIYLLMSDQESVIPLDFINKIFAMGSDDNLKEMYFLPKTELGLLFGLGGESGRIDGYLHSDVGYVREVFKYGILGLVGVLFIHSIIYLQAWIACKDKKTFKLLIFMGILAVVLSFKNNYFFTRAFFPCLMLLQIYSYKSLRVDCLSADKSKIIN